jgi:hypothetical protein
MLSVAIFYRYAECRYTEWRYAECRGAGWECLQETNTLAYYNCKLLQ